MTIKKSLWLKWLAHEWMNFRMIIRNWNANQDFVLIISRYIQSKPYAYIYETIHSHKVIFIWSEQLINFQSNFSPVSFQYSDSWAMAGADTYLTHWGRDKITNIFKCILLNENIWISLNISLKCVSKVRINNIPTLVQIMVRRRTGDKPWSEPMMS